MKGARQEPLGDLGRQVLARRQSLDLRQRQVEQAVSLAAFCQARSTALHVHDPLVASLPGLPVPAVRVKETDLDRAREDTYSWVQAANATGVPVDVVVEVGRPAHCILDAGPCTAPVLSDLPPEHAAALGACRQSLETGRGND